LLLPFLKIYLGDFGKIGDVVADKKDDWGSHYGRHARHCPRQSGRDGQAA
jgi:hypothetical protein